MINNTNTNISGVDLKVKFKFTRFLDEFEVTEYQRVMRFLKRVLVEYEENPFKLLGK
jgi:hypothetical protein